MNEEIVILRSLPYALVSAVSLTLGLIWTHAMITGGTDIVLNINGYGEGWAEAVVFLAIGLIGLWFMWRDRK
jgi:lysozyme family protein